MPSTSSMAWSKSTRIKIMIAIDTAFFLLELISGFLAHSLALTADAFHMLNDIISLAIGLWAVIASQKATTDEFTFGWVRAEILGAFFNAVFLIALCVSIILEALTRFVEPPEITNPKLILIVGCAGLFSNLLGFVSRGREHQRRPSRGHSRFTSIEDMSIHPASFRQEIIAASRAASSNVHAESGDESPFADSETEANEESALLPDGKANLSYSTGSAPKKQSARRDSSVHHGHNHTLPRQAGAKVSGHNHADMGMHAMMLHVIGDALGNVGVIITALVIWLTNWPGKLYADPAVSLVITAIILKTSIPLTLATSRVLLQATPENISIPEIRQDIEQLPGVVSCHHIHVWQLSDTKIVASMHLQVSFPIDTRSGEKYMQLARRARKCLHGYGIHSATIQPEFCLDIKHQHDGEEPAFSLDGASDEQIRPCLLECVDNCQAQGCCMVDTSSASSTRRASESSRSEAQHDHQH
ncbi:putative Cd2+/Zn2+ transporter protein [Trichoderma atroviride IMI 206040]|uniref:Cd2+/Zn2+ transporter protein n=1 Tax=Hypocrea atroviridis (strain ATCC 20476 / IMI 206040) TaxID=452589 RepID=G9PAD9_HYPAI|nr:putative Cd2+/Zn2+ transporter protein [Trichoderma atroviride IMI 206040]EHK40509.1 putative Cd2+/Zn2+ transporter protein [Trichoderma atroviride IMI 206040]